MNLPLDIPALLKAATDIDEARNTPLAVSVYIDETAPGDVVGHVRSAFASAGAKTRVTIGYLDDNPARRALRGRRHGGHRRRGFAAHR